MSNRKQCLIYPRPELHRRLRMESAEQDMGYTEILSAGLKLVLAKNPKVRKRLYNQERVEREKARVGAKED